MKKSALLLIPATVFPYSLIFALICIFSGFLMESVFHSNALELFLPIGILFILSLVCSIIFVKRAKLSACSIARFNMISKLVQIPAYVAIFILGVLFTLTLFTIPFTIFFFLFDCLAIFLTGIVGAAAACSCGKQGALPRSVAFILGLTQFFFCIDVLLAVFMYFKSKHAELCRSGS